MEVPELTADGRRLRAEDLPKRVRPKRPKRHDSRWTHGAEPLRPWPLTDGDLRAWVSARFWQFAKTSPRNPHEYTHRAWGHEETFLRVVLHLREHGRQELYGGDIYTYYVADGFKHWTMGGDLMSTILINRKPLGQDEGDEEAARTMWSEPPLVVVASSYGCGTTNSSSWGSVPSRRFVVFSGLIWPGAKLAIEPSIGRFNREVARLML